MNIIVKKVNEEPKVVSYEEFGLDEMQEIVGGLIEAVYVGGEIDLWCNDEGKIFGLPSNIALGDVDERRLLDVINGDIFFAARNESGDTIGLTEAQSIWIMNQFKNPPYILTIEDDTISSLPVWHYNPTATL